MAVVFYGEGQVAFALHETQNKACIQDVPSATEINVRIVYHTIHTCRAECAVVRVETQFV